MFRVLTLLRDPAVDDREIEAEIQSDVGLSYKLLRMANAAAIGGRDMWSILHALHVLGRDQLSGWLAVMLVSESGESGMRAQQAQLALVHARMCELVAQPAGNPRAARSLFLVGLFSVLDQLLEVPMATLCAVTDLAPDLRRALLFREDFFGVVLRLVECCVAGQWPEMEMAAAQLGIDTATLAPLHTDALVWASAQIRD
jgi:EAL and modified HD-GYP domain-containing signal transduction protein